MRAFVEAAAGIPAVPRTAAPRGAAGSRRSGRPGPVVPPAPAAVPAALAVLAAAPVTARRAPRAVVRPWRRLLPDERGPSRTAA